MLELFETRKIPRFKSACRQSDAFKYREQLFSSLGCIPAALKSGKSGADFFE
jgi:hypothetical protein